MTDDERDAVDRDRGDESELRDLRERIEALTIAISVRSVPRIVGSLLKTTLTIQQLKALTAIVVSDGVTTSELALSFGVSLATTSKLVDRIAEQGLVTREHDAADQRIRRLVPTALGREVVAEIVGARPELGQDVIEGLSADELRALEIGMRAVNRELQRPAR